MGASRGKNIDTGQEPHIRLFDCVLLTYGVVEEAGCSGVVAQAMTSDVAEAIALAFGNRRDLSTDFQRQLNKETCGAQMVVLMAQCASEPGVFLQTSVDLVTGSAQSACVSNCTTSGRFITPKVIRAGRGVVCNARYVEGSGMPTSFAAAILVFSAVTYWGAYLLAQSY